ncbi:hypothetical protein LPY96_19295 [Xanthomonas citri pv. malvacearum]|uniref:hypothetical protein n=1 Tax=Xanthomonas citri TaxID=346 RepID=UPI0022B03620|nr:hypothetical protein [Xanthomonas citri]WAW86371.1 hypothetical protein LPY96_19295 [Xanthomonas citri pv. malvacearum]
MRDFSDVPAIFNSTQLLAALSVAPEDRLLVFTDDLSDDEFDTHGYATRTDINVLLVIEGDPALNGNGRSGRIGRIVGVIGSQDIRDDGGRQTPGDIYALMNQAENRAGPLAWVSDDVFALPEHPRAERRV